MTRFHLVTGAVALALFAAVCWWQSPGHRLDAHEIDDYVARIETMAMPPEEKPEILRRMREFAESDDGGAFYMLNLMRYRDALRRYPGTPGSDLTPVQANAHYESSVMGLALARGAYPLAAGAAPSGSLLPTQMEAGQWGRVLVMRYPSRRSFFELLTDPKYAPYAPYKFMAMDIALVPASAEMVWPEYRWLAGGVLLSVFLGLGWWRSARAGS